jgi:regulator of replication initiation timing
MYTRQGSTVLRSAILAGLLLWTGVGLAQETAHPQETASDTSLSDSVRELRQQIRELQAAVSEIRSESQRYRAETTELRRELDTVRDRTTVASTAPSVNPPAPSNYASASEPSSGEAQQDYAMHHAATLEEEYQLLSGKVDEQYQTKVESASKYRMRLSGIVLLNLFSNVGTVDNADIPSLAYDRPPGASRGSFGGTVRQSQIGLEVFGPQFAGARTKADLQLDLGGGFPRTLDGVNFGLLRLRTGTMRLDWAHTSIIAGQDGLFFSPSSPTSFASLAIPAFSYAGNLWGWVPQVRVEHRFTIGEESNVVVQGGILDSQSGEPPVFNSYRTPQAGERSRQPAYATRIAWTHNIFGQPLRLGVAGFYGRQSYGFDRNVDAWSGMSDLEVPLTKQFSLSGKVYRGKGLGGLGGGIGRSVLFSGDPGSLYSQVRGLNSAGGWAQLKYRPASKIELNGAFGLDNPYIADLRAFSNPQSYGDPTLTKNQGSMFNVIYRPRSDLLFSAEYRHLKTFTIDNGTYNADHINLMMGVLF